MRVLVTGGAGYLGSVLVPMLLDAGHQVTVMDNFMYRQNSLAGCCHRPQLSILRIDIRTEIRPFLRTCDAVVALAAIVGAPACERDKAGANSTNYSAIARLCEHLSTDQILIYPNTNSGYGVGGEALCTEDMKLHPVSLYGTTKVEAENHVLSHPRGVSLRFATLFGMSPRMRLDLMVNDFVYRAKRDHALVLFEAKFRRNFLHVRDAADTIIYALEHANTMGANAYNAGLSSANLTKIELCERIREQIPGFTWVEAPVGQDPDRRDYVVSNAKLEATGWSARYELREGITELKKGFQMPFQSFSNAP